MCRLRTSEQGRLDGRSGRSTGLPVHRYDGLLWHLAAHRHRQLSARYSTPSTDQHFCFSTLDISLSNPVMHKTT